MKRFFIPFLVIFLCQYLGAQDLILKRTGEEINGKVIEITPDQIFYTDSVTIDVRRSIPKSEVVAILYKNGYREIFKQELPKVTANNQQNKNNNIQPEGEIIDLGSNDYSINGRIYHFRYVKSLLLGLNNDTIRILLAQARVSGVIGNVLAYTSIGVGYIGLVITAQEISSYYGTGNPGPGLIMSATCIGMNVSNIFLKINKRKKIAKAIEIYNDTIRSRSQN